MTAQTKFKSDAFEAIHQAASSLQKANAITKKTMREYDALCISKAPIYHSLCNAALSISINAAHH